MRINIKEITKQLNKMKKISRWLSFFMRYGERIEFRIKNDTYIYIIISGGVYEVWIDKNNNHEKLSCGNFEDIMDMICNFYDTDKNNELRISLELDEKNNHKIKEGPHS